jgi:hypothetical protein
MLIHEREMTRVELRQEFEKVRDYLCDVLTRPEAPTAVDLAMRRLYGTLFDIDQHLDRVLAQASTDSFKEELLLALAVRALDRILAIT